LGTLVLPQPKEGDTQTKSARNYPHITKSRVVLFKNADDAHADWAKHDDIGNRLRDIANQIGVIKLACNGLRETISDEIQGLVEMAHRLQREIEDIIEEVRA
jgi:hypothetical protein